LPPVVSQLAEEPEPDAPYGVKGVGEPPTVVSTPAIVAALRDATGRELTRVPVRPDEFVGLRQHAGGAWRPPPTNGRLCPLRHPATLPSEPEPHAPSVGTRLESQL